jgi:hypothetical protein
MLSFASVTRMQPTVRCPANADGPLPRQRRLEDGSLWNNRIIPEKLRPALTLDDHRGQHR